MIFHSDFNVCQLQLMCACLRAPTMLMVHACSGPNYPSPRHMGSRVQASSVPPRCEPLKTALSARFVRIFTSAFWRAVANNYANGWW